METDEQLIDSVLHLYQMIGEMTDALNEQCAELLRQRRQLTELRQLIEVRNSLPQPPCSN